MHLQPLCQGEEGCRNDKEDWLNKRDPLNKEDSLCKKEDSLCKQEDSLYKQEDSLCKQEDSLCSFWQQADHLLQGPGFAAVDLNILKHFS